MKWFVGIPLMLCACGSVSNTNTKVDAKPMDDSALPAIDAPMPDASPPRCNPTAAFQTPVALATINTSADEMSATLSADELTLYFCSSRTGGPGGGDIWYATRSSRTAPWGTPTVLPTVNTAAGNECVTSLTADGLTMYLHTYTANNLDIAVATRATTNDTFGAYSIPGTPLNAAGTVADGHAEVSADGNTLYFVSSRGTSTNEDLWSAKRVNGTWGTPALVPGIPTTALEVSPVFTADELTLFYESYSGGGEIMLATRGSTTANFTGIQPQTTLNVSNADEAPDFLTADGCELYFTRLGNDADLFVARRGM